MKRLISTSPTRRPSAPRSGDTDIMAKRLAVISSIYTYLSHTQHFADRFLVGYPRSGRGHRPGGV
ncbi:MAG: hypothetical protein F4104_06445, partial [Gemmatimonadetes bacterium]|nr:hypothetical protein [Gemmatimonadota bacterium]